MESRDRMQFQIKALSEQLESPNSSVRIKAFRELESLRDVDVVEPLISSLGKRTPIIKARLCDTLGNIGSDKGVKFLITCLKSPEKNVRLSACAALDKIGDPSSVAALFGRLRDENSEIRKTALNALERMGDGRLARAILNKDIQDLIRILEKDDPRAIDPLMEQLRSQSRNDRKAILKALSSSFEQYRQAHEQFLCLEHLTRFKKVNNKQVTTGLFKRLPYYGCRICGKTINTLTDVREVVALFNTKMHLTASLDDGVFEVNYLAHDELFDFDRVEIINVSDEVIEKFMMKLSKNHNNLLCKKCGEIECRIYGNGGISPSNVELLSTIFHNVEQI